MSERMWLAEELEQARTQRDVLRVRVKELEEVIQTQNGVVVSGTLKLNEARARVAKLEAALKQSVELQSHYAELLNMHDGGQRLTFANVEAWLDRLAALQGCAPMSERLTDEGYRAWIDDGSPNELEGWAIILSLRAENARLREALNFLMTTRWKSVDKDNMEFEGRVTCYQLDKARAALKDEP